MHKPRLVIRLAVALIAFIIGISATLLVNHLWPRTSATPPTHRVIVTTRVTTDAPHAPCAGHAAVQPAFAWTPDEPPAPPAPPAPPVAPQPPARPRAHR